MESPEPLNDLSSLDYYCIEELLTGDERAARDRARRFVQEEVMHEIVPCHRAGKFPDLALPIDIFADDQMIGFGGQLSSAKSSAPGPVYIAELHADLLLRDELANKFREIEKFPAATRDIAMFVPEEISHEKISRTIREPREPLLESVELFDLFSGGGGQSGFGPARKSLAYRLTYRDRSRTLTSEEVSAAHAKIRERLRSDLGAELRE